ncbi:dTDP-4-dehydrorhamnose reductase [Shewanella goraebulensis]|uniref:dTDP-4-dehydrorhamnose reductase n=1 Tax=Shewanella goraebulensis TaxID=3050637 RepID=UPI00255179D7|nr:dTDP-4-dehydrorhamnose reductase [Shewanella goraebulensis]
MVRVLVTGKGGQLATELSISIPNFVEFLCLSSDELNICDSDEVDEVITSFNPDVVVNAAAYTRVDLAENNSAQSFLVNEQGVKNLAKACQNINAQLIHISTDYVYDGTGNKPYKTTEQVSPVNVYGHSKLAGENALKAFPELSKMVIRTSWVYSKYGNNFVKTILNLLKSKQSVSVIYDQIGTPTWAAGLADTIWETIAKQFDSSTQTFCPTSSLLSTESDKELAVYHWTDAGVASWYDFAESIQDLAFEKGLIEKKIPIIPIPDSDFPTIARRPRYSVLCKAETESFLGKQTQHWRKQLSLMLDELKIESETT